MLKTRETNGIRHDEHGAVSNTFVIVNKAPRPVRVSLISAGCGCTVIALTNREVAAGRRVEIPASLGLRGRRGPVSKRFMRLGPEGSRRIELRNLPWRGDLAGQLVRIRTDNPTRPAIAVPPCPPLRRE